MVGGLCRVFLALASPALLLGCAGAVDYKVLGGHLRADDCDAATAYVAEKRQGYGPNRRLLFLLDSAQVNLLCGRHEESNRYFHEAEALAEELWTKSVSREASALLTSDYVLPYEGEDFEKALINLFSAINYALLGRLDEALVECRRLDSNLTLYNDKYSEKNVYKEDAFGRYLSGIIYEAAGNLEDAYIDYYKAYGVFVGDYEKNYGTSAPRALVEDLLRTADATRRLDELRADFGLEGRPGLRQKAARRMAKVVLIHFTGSSPVKKEEDLIVPSRSGPIKIAFPRFEVSRPGCRSSEVTAASSEANQRQGSELVEDINAIALKNLDDRKARIIAKTLARAAIKQAVIHGAATQIEDDGAREAAKLVMNIINLAVERADTRSWRTLPAEVYLARAFVPPGDYRVEAAACGSTIKRFGTVSLKAGETKFLLISTVFDN